MRSPRWPGTLRFDPYAQRARGLHPSAVSLCHHAAAACSVRPSHAPLCPSSHGPLARAQTLCTRSATCLSRRCCSPAFLSRLSLALSDPSPLNTLPFQQKTPNIGHGCAVVCPLLENSPPFGRARPPRRHEAPRALRPRLPPSTGPLGPRLWSTPDGSGGMGLPSQAPRLVRV
jgi:hypothetical protein